MLAADKNKYTRHLSQKETTVSPRPFEYHAPQSLHEAIGLLTQYGDEAKLLAGGHSLLPMMKLRFAQPAHLVDLGKIPGLKGISEVGNEIHIGAMTTENEQNGRETCRKRVSQYD